LLGVRHIGKIQVDLHVGDFRDFACDSWLFLTNTFVPLQDFTGLWTVGRPSRSPPTFKPQSHDTPLGGPVSSASVQGGAASCLVQVAVPLPEQDPPKVALLKTISLGFGALQGMKDQHLVVPMISGFTAHLLEVGHCLELMNSLKELLPQTPSLRRLTLIPPSLESYLKCREVFWQVFPENLSSTTRAPLIRPNYG
jgi:hypothetical protein